MSLFLPGQGSPQSGPQIGNLRKINRSRMSSSNDGVSFRW
jgi:hypothetical protein